MKILVVDDDKVTRDLLKEIFERDHFQVELAANGEIALQMLEQEIFPILLSDIRMFDVGGMALLSHVKNSGGSTVVILMTGFGTMEGAVGAIQEGAFDYISKPFKITELKSLVARAARHWEEINNPSAVFAPTSPFASRKLIGKAPKIVEVYKTLARATLSQSNVLILGESGTGKELVARAIHENSTRRTAKFVAVNCGALAETLLESELFGHVKGAFTGAVSNQPGLFAEADRGTLFLDEIGDISGSLQVKLLRVLQEGEFKPVGSNENHRVDVRLIAATHRDLDEGVRRGTFREDLYYRLKVILIDLPPLRERMDDLPDLVSHFLGINAEKTGKRISHIAPEAMELLQGYEWPGNIRELEHAIERAVAMTRTTVLYPEDFPVEMGKMTEPETPGSPKPIALEDVEREHILKVLQEFNFNKSKAAARLGIDRKTLYRKAQRYKINLPDQD
jgi:two-component system response regulator AtoC